MILAFSWGLSPSTWSRSRVQAPDPTGALHVFFPHHPFLLGEIGFSYPHPSLVPPPPPRSVRDNNCTSILSVIRLSVWELFLHLGAEGFILHPVELSTLCKGHCISPGLKVWPLTQATSQPRVTGMTIGVTTALKVYDPLSDF